MSPELFATQTHMRARELHTTADRERRARSFADRRRRDARIAAIRAWFARRRPVTVRQAEPCSTC